MKISEIDLSPKVTRTSEKIIPIEIVLPDEKTAQVLTIVNEAGKGLSYVEAASQLDMLFKSKDKGVKE